MDVNTKATLVQNYKNMEQYDNLANGLISYNYNIIATCT